MGTILISAIMDDAEKLLQDDGNDQWSEAELFAWGNDAQKIMASIKPDINIVNESIVLVAGTKQSLPSTATQLIKITRNMGTNGTTPGGAIRLSELDTFSYLLPNWNTETASATVQNYFYSNQDPKVFYVYPQQPSSNFGYVEIITAKTPTDMVKPAGDYDVAINLDDIYSQVYLYLILHKAYLKETSPYSTQKATYYFTQAATLLGAKDAKEREDDPNIQKLIKKQAMGR
jgi:hypothetical protein